MLFNHHWPFYLLGPFDGDCRSPNPSLAPLNSSEGYPGQSNTSATRRTSAYSGASMTNWTDSPTTLSTKKPRTNFAEPEDQKKRLKRRRRIHVKGEE